MIGLYYPYIHFRDEAWFKAAFLYWPRMARMVPLGYATNDSDAVRSINDISDFVVDVDPLPATFEASSMFTRLLNNHGDELAKHLAVLDRRSGSNLGQYSDGDVAYIYAPKIAPSLRAQLMDLGLAATRDKMPAVWAHHQHSIHSHRGPEWDWVGLDERLASVYMCVLASELALRNKLSPTTDQVRTQLASGAWSTERVAEALLGLSLPSTQHGQEPDLEGVRATIALLALRLAVPKGIGHIPVEKLARFRSRHGAELEAFQAEVAAAARELESLPSTIGPEVLSAYLKEVVEKRFVIPRRNLKKSLAGLKMEVVDAVMNLKVTLPTAVLGIGADGRIAVGAGAAAATYTISRSISARRASIRADEAGVSYLLSLNRDLDPKRTVVKSLHVVRALAPRGRSSDHPPRL